MAKVKVSQGWLEGEVLELVTGDGHYYSFKGVPYAAPPLGKLRFKAPQPPLPWSGIRKATSHGPECTQIDIFTNSLVPGSEDCLFLNVYTRDLTPKKPLPVMLFIHGGGYKSGSGNVMMYGPDFLVNHGVVLVTINYRLGPLGFLCLDTEDVPGNAGLKDQVAALKWVKENIINFGGDPDNVTVFGESAGGSSVALHVLSPMSKGLFKRAISMSGVPSSDWSLPNQATRRAFTLGKLLGIHTNDPKELLEFLQSVPAEKLVDQNPTVLASEEITTTLYRVYYFTPVIEKNFGKVNFLSESPMEIIKKGNISDVDIFIGNTSEESLFAADDLPSLIDRYNRYPEIYAPTKLLIECTSATVLEASDRIIEYYFGKKPLANDNIKQFIRYISDSAFGYDIHRFADLLPQKRSGKTYFYTFSCLSQRNFFGNKGAKYEVQGASHLDDLLYLFDAKSFNMPIDKDSREYKLVQLVNKVFTNFAKYGTPSTDNSWPEYDSSSKKYVDIGDQLTVGQHYRTEQYHFWKSIMQNAGIDF